MDLVEIITFNYDVTLGFAYLNTDLQNTLYNVLCEDEFESKQFEIITILDFTIKEILVIDRNICCKLKIKANCLYPCVQKVLTVTDFSLIENSTIIKRYGNRIQIAADIEDGSEIVDSYKIKIVKVQSVWNTIMCIAEII